MGSKDETHQSRQSEEVDLINLDEIDDDELTRKKLREWALQHSKGEVPARTANTFTTYTFHRSTAIASQKKDDPQDSKEEAGSSEAKDIKKYQFPDWSKHIAESPEMNKKKPTPSRYRHTRRMSSTAIRPFIIPRQHQRLNANIPPVPPIPEKYRAEWEWQEMKRKAEATNAEYPAFHPGGKKPTNSKYVRKPQPAYPNAVNAAKKEAARRANEKRQKAFEAVVLGDEKDRTKAKENERGPGRPLPRSDVRLPRSPGMLNLAQQKPEWFNQSPEAEGSLHGLPEPKMNQDFGGEDEDEDEDEGDEHDVDDGDERPLFNRPLSEVNKLYVDSIDFASEVAEMEAEAETKMKRMNLK